LIERDNEKLSCKEINMNLNRAIVILTLLFAFLATGCRADTVEPTPDIAGTAAAMAETIVAVQLTKIAEAATSTPTPTPEPTQTPTPTLTFALPTVYPTQEVNTATGPCLMAHMLSETIPDYTVLEAGEKFDKSWQIQNVGTCPWTNEFSIVYNRLEKLGAPDRVNFPGQVLPGESFTITIPMVAPAVAGEHKSFWHLESADGEAFGTYNSSIFWAWIIVEDVIPQASMFDLWAPIAGGGVKEDGETDNSIVAGDSRHNHAWQGFVTFDLANIPRDATVTGVSMVFEGHNLTGTPFIDLGCMGIYRYNYGNLDPGDFFSSTPGGALWSYCSSGEVGSRYGGDTALSAVQNSLGGLLQFRFQFNNNTNNDGEDDYAIFFPNLRVEYTTP
jgi:hypothetical protein